VCGVTALHGAFVVDDCSGEPSVKRVSGGDGTLIVDALADRD
jgi:hypothetical protein